MRILVAEDEHTIARLAAQVLKAMGHQVVTVGTCTEAIASIQGEDLFDLVLLDLHLSDGDSYQVIEAVESMNTVNPRIILMTGEAHPEDDPRVARVAGVLAKPFDIGQLEEIVARFAD